MIYSTFLFGCVATAGTRGGHGGQMIVSPEAILKEEGSSGKKSCPEGYESKGGHVNGSGVIRQIKEKNMNMESCSEKCTEDVECVAFEWDSARKRCQLNKDDKPVQTNKPKPDWSRCVKAPCVKAPDWKEAKVEDKCGSKHFPHCKRDPEDRNAQCEELECYEATAYKHGKDVCNKHYLPKCKRDQISGCRPIVQESEAPKKPGGWKPKGARPSVLGLSNELPTSFDIPRIPDTGDDIYYSVAHEIKEGNDVVFEVVRNPKFFKITRPSEGKREYVAKLTEVEKNEEPDFVYLPYKAGAITSINMAEFPNLAVLSDRFTGCWMNTISGKNGALEQVVHVGTVLGNSSVNDEWNRFATNNPEKKMKGFRPANLPIVFPFAEYQGYQSSISLQKQFNPSLDTFGLIQPGDELKMYTLLVPNEAQGKNSSPASYVLREIKNQLEEPSGKIII